MEPSGFTEDHSGIVTVLFSGIGTAFAAALAYWQRQQRKNDLSDRDEEEKSREAARVNLDTAQQTFLDNLLADNKKYREDGQLWEGRARRIDRIAHKMRHDWNNERFASGKMDPLPELPFLEDPL